MRNLAGRFCYDPLLRWDFLPGSAPGNSWLQQVGNHRILRLPDTGPWNILRPPGQFRTSYSMGNDSLLWLWHRLQKTQPKVIVEFGSGMSTLLFAAYAAQTKSRPLVISIEAEAPWLEQTRAALAYFDLSGFVSCLHAPVREGVAGAPTTYAVTDHDWTFLLSDRKVDFVLIDGPPGSVERAPVLPLIASRLTETANVFVDDAFRPGEQAAVKSWQETYKHTLKVRGCYPVGKGMAWLVGKGIPRRD